MGWGWTVVTRMGKANGERPLKVPGEVESHTQGHRAAVGWLELRITECQDCYQESEVPRLGPTDIFLVKEKRLIQKQPWGQSEETVCLKCPPLQGSRGTLEQKAGDR